MLDDGPAADAAKLQEILTADEKFVDLPTVHAGELDVSATQNFAILAQRSKIISSVS